MIYVYTTENDILPSSQYQFCTKQDVLDYLQPLEEISLDLETTGFDPHTERILSVQVGNRDNQYVIDCRHEDDISWLKAPLECKIIIGQNSI